MKNSHSLKYLESEVEEIFALDKRTDLYISLYGFAINPKLSEVKKQWEELRDFVQKDHCSPAGLYFSLEPISELREHEKAIFGRYQKFFDDFKLRTFGNMVCNLERVIKGYWTKEEEEAEEHRLRENLSLESAQL